MRSHVHRAWGRHSTGERGDRETSRHRGSDRRDAAAYEDLGPGNSCLIERAGRHAAHVAGFGLGSKTQRCAGLMLEIRRRHPAERFTGKHDRATGRLLAVVWENLADAIISGRDETGWPKIYADIVEPRFWDGTPFASSSWQSPIRTMRWLSRRRVRRKGP